MSAERGTAKMCALWSKWRQCTSSKIWIKLKQRQIDSSITLTPCKPIDLMFSPSSSFSFRLWRLVFDSTKKNFDRRLIDSIVWKRRRKKVQLHSSRNHLNCVCVTWIANLSKRILRWQQTLAEFFPFIFYSFLRSFYSSSFVHKKEWKDEIKWHILLPSESNGITLQRSSLEMSQR